MPCVTHGSGACLFCLQTDLCGTIYVEVMKTPVLCLFVHFWLPLLGKAAPKPEWIELSYQFNNETIYWPTSLAFKHVRLSENFTAAGFYYSAYDIITAEHGGTHIDSPRHFAANRWTTDQIPLDRLSGPAIKIDVSSKAAQVMVLLQFGNGSCCNPVLVMILACAT